MHWFTRAIPVLVAASVGLLPVLPAEHVHDLDGDHGHQRLVTHRHSEPHHPGQRHAGTTLDEVDPVATVNETVFTTPTKRVVAAPLVSQPMVVVAAPAQRSLVLRETPKELIHGPPPSPSLLRGPPSFPPL